MDIDSNPNSEEMAREIDKYRDIDHIQDFAKILDSETTVLFFLPLPFDMHLRYPSQSRLFFTRADESAPWIKFTGGKNFVGIEFWNVPDPPDRYIRQDILAEVITQHRITKNPLLTFPGLGAEFQGIEPVDRTLVELATAVKIESVEQARQAISDGFDRCLEELNSFLRAYRTTSNDPAIRPVTRQTCRPIIPMLFERIVNDHPEYYAYALFATHLPATYSDSSDELSEKELWNLSVSLSRHQRHDPFSVWADIARSAHRYYLVDGDYSACVISCQTAFEVLLNTTLLCIGWESRTPRTETRMWTRDRSPFLSRITTHLQPRLKGNWTQTSADFKRVSSIRNNIVHDGRVPNETDAKDCLEAVARVEGFVKDRLAYQRKRYPRTSLLLLGEPGLKKRDAWDHWTQNWVDENAADEPDWILDFLAWRDS